MMPIGFWAEVMLIRKRGILVTYWVHCVEWRSSLGRITPCPGTGLVPAVKVALLRVFLQLPSRLDKD